MSIWCNTRVEDFIASQDRFSELIRDRIAPTLRREGFKRARFAFLKDEAECLSLVQYQKSRGSDSECVQFTANLGVASKRLLDFFNPTWRERSLMIDQCQWRVRLGRLLPERRNAWWELCESDSIEPAAQEHNRLLEDRVIPAVARYASDQALTELWRTGEAPGITEFERLMNLIVMLESPESREEQGRWIAELKRFESEKGSTGRGEALLEELEARRR